MSGDKLSAFNRGLAAKWPPGDAEGLLRFARETGNTGLLSAYLDLAPLDQALAFANAHAGESSDDFISGAMEKQGRLARSYLGNSTLPLDERIAGALRFSNGASREQVLGSMVVSDLVTLQADQDSVSQLRLFGTGEVDAAAVLEDARARLPELAQAAPDAVRAEVFRQLSLTDPQRAVALLDPLPPAERAAAIEAVLLNGGAVQYEGRSLGGYMDPRRAYELLQELPAGDTATRSRIWERIVRDGRQFFGGDFTTWVDTLPEGADKNTARTLLATPEGGSQ
ncbi:MAG: hypothetical protein QM755_21855 [Luteolibacter sp.]